MKWLDGIADSMEVSLGKLQEMVRTGKPGVLQSMGSQSIRHDSATEQQRHIIFIYGETVARQLYIWFIKVAGLEVFTFNP